MTLNADKVKNVRNWDQFYQIFKRLPAGQALTKLFTKKMLQQILTCVATTAKELASTKKDDHLKILWLEPEGMELLDEGLWLGLVAPLLGASSIKIDFLKPKISQGFKSPNPRAAELLPATDIRIMSQASSIDPLESYTHIIWSHPAWEQSFAEWQDKLPKLFQRTIHVFGWSALDAALEGEYARIWGLDPTTLRANPFSNESKSEVGSGWARYCYELPPSKEVKKNDELLKEFNWLMTCRHHSGLMGFANPRWQPGSRMKSTNAGKDNKMQDYVYVLDNVLLNVKTRVLYHYHLDELPESYNSPSNDSEREPSKNHSYLTRISEAAKELVEERPKGTVDLLDAYKWAVKLKTAYFMGPTKETAQDQSIFNALNRRAETGDALACYCVGGWHEHGVSGQKSLEEALKWYRAAADKGFSSAMYTVGDMLWNAHNTAAIQKEAIGYWLKASEEEHAGALHNLGVIHLDGIGLPSNQELAFGYLQQSAKLGQPHSQAVMAEILLSQGDRKAALNYLIEAADQGHRDAAFNAARLIEDEIKAGNRRPRDMKIVKMYDAMANEQVH